MLRQSQFQQFGNGGDTQRGEGSYLLQHWMRSNTSFEHFWVTFQVDLFLHISCLARVEENRISSVVCEFPGLLFVELGTGVFGHGDHNLKEETFFRVSIWKFGLSWYFYGRTVLIRHWHISCWNWAVKFMEKALNDLRSRLRIFSTQYIPYSEYFIGK